MMLRFATFAVVRIVLGLLLLLAFGSESAAQLTRGERCRTPSTEHGFGTLHVYRVEVPDHSELSLSLYFNNDNSAFAVSAQLRDGPVVLGAGSWGRFVNARVSMAAGGTLEISVTCINAAADYRLSVKAGDYWRRIPPPTRAFATGLDAAGLLRERDRENLLLPLVASIITRGR